MENEKNELDEIPSINKRSTFSKATLILFGIGIALIIFVLFVSSKQTKKTIVQDQTYKRADTSGKFEYPKLPDIPKPAPPEKLEENKQQQQYRMQNGQRQLTWQERKMLAPFRSGGGTGSQLNEQKPQQIKEESPLKIEATKISAIGAAILPNMDYLIARGRDFDCVLEDAINTQHAGEVSCLVSSDVYSESGNIILIDKGSKAVGKAQGGTNIVAGQSRIGVSWDRLTTPNGVVVNLQGTGTDNLGRTGLEGYVDNHFIERFGAAIAISLLQTTTQIASQNLIPNNGAGQTNFFGGGMNSGGQQIVESILRQQANQPPTIEKHQGDSIQVRILKDIDFTEVYKLTANP